MHQPANKKALVAIDLGAQSCRVSLLRWERGVPELRIAHRFPNGPISEGENLRWDIRRIFAGVVEGLRACAASAPEGIASVAIDGWGVDYARLDAKGQLAGNPFCYRDERNISAMKEVYSRISADRLYELTGIQRLPFNTIFQLYADARAGIDPQSRWLNLPEYTTHLLGGEPVAEFTNATHTQLVALETRDWCEEIFAAAQLCRTAAPKIVSTGTVVGKIRYELNRLPELDDTTLIAPACHDTASAIAAIPARGDDWAFISSGTWSLVGVVLDVPNISGDAKRMNFTNLGGAGGKICFLKNVNGMWLLQQCMEDWARAGQAWTVEELIRSCERLPVTQKLFDVDDPALMLPGDMHGKINKQMEAAGFPAFAMNERGIPQMANAIFHSLAKRYTDVLAAVSGITGKQLKRLFVVGGGSKNAYLNRLTAERSGLEVIAGPSECATIGNFVIQLAAAESGGANSSGVTAERVTHYAEMLAAQMMNFGM
jgi:rhamnulokinase